MSPTDWNKRWWLCPGEVAATFGDAELIFEGDDGAQWQFSFRTSSSTCRVHWDHQACGFVAGSLDPLSPDIAVVLKETVRAMMPCTLGWRPQGISQKVIDAIAQAMMENEWITGRRLRALLNMDRVQFLPIADDLQPRYLRAREGDSGDGYSLTIPGLWFSSGLSRSRKILGAIVETLVDKFRDDADVRSFTLDDVVGTGVLDDGDRCLTISIVTLTGLMWGGQGTRSDRRWEYTWGVPREIEDIAHCSSVDDLFRVFQRHPWPPYSMRCWPTAPIRLNIMQCDAASVSPPAGAPEGKIPPVDHAQSWNSLEVNAAAVPNPSGVLTHANAEFIDELSRLFSGDDEAKLLACNAGYPRGDIPNFKTPRLFWSLVVQAVLDGKVKRGMEKLAAAAVKLYPANVVFTSYVTRLGAEEGPAKIIPLPTDAEISWIHLSDFHAGQPGKSVWHQVDTELRHSVREKVKQLGPPDLVIFTGDLANHGKEEEYKEVDRLLDRLNEWVGRELPVVAVPGNHDVVRPGDSDSWRYSAFKRYEDEPGLRKALWEGTDPLLEPLFPHYAKWANDRVVGSLKRAGWKPYVSPRVPGDLSVVVEKNGLRLGLVGLNSAWTDLSDGAKGTLQLPIEQFHAALPGGGSASPLEWFDGVDAAFLLTHHPYDWLSKAAQATYLSGVYRSEYFDLTLFGHMHEARSVGVSVSGGKPRVFSQASSVFGLEHYGTKKESRVMGYAWGRLTAAGEVRVWPLARVRRGNESYVFDCDQSFEEEKDALGGVVQVRGEANAPAKESPPAGAGAGSTSGTSALMTNTPPLVSHEELKHYLAKIDSLHRELHLAGFETKVRVPIDLDELYIPLDAVVDRSAKRRQMFHSGEDALGHDSEVPLARAFEVARTQGKRGMRGVVLLGDPGSGKTTHLKQVLLQVVREGAESIGLPEGMVPVFLPLRKLRDLDAGLPGFIQQELCDPVLDVAEDFGKRLCERGRLLLLFDGLDEVASAEDRRKVARWIEAARRGRADNYFLVSCRFSGYTLDAQLDERFLELHLRPMSSTQVESFVRKWYGIVEQATNEDHRQAELKAEAGADSLLSTLQRPEMSSTRVYTMTHNPLLLTTICLVHRDRGELPEKRVVLYEEAVLVLLERWRRVTKELSVTFPADEARLVLQPIAWWMHQEQGCIRAKTAELEQPVTEGLEAIDRGDLSARMLLETIRDESGLLTGWGVDEFGFMHLGFQEYLVARSIQMRAVDEPELLGWLAEHFDDSWWQEVLLLLLGQQHSPMFKRFMVEVVRQPQFPEWARSKMMGLCWNEAFGVSEGPFVALLREVEGDATLGARQWAAAELLARRMPGVLEGLEAQEGLLRAHPALEVRQWWEARVRREAAVETIVATRGGVELVCIPGGRFLMGSPDDEEGRYDDEGPQHTVELSTFYLARTPVTNAQYREYLKANSSVEEPKFWGDRRYNQDDQPVVGVSWNEAKAYCAWAGLSLPTEAQWEYACRAGTTTRYHSGDSEDDLVWVGWYTENSDFRLHTASELEPNSWGLYDMHGNVDEWCEDTWVENYRDVLHRAGDGLRTQPAGDVHQVVRGGYFDNRARDTRSVYRNGFAPDSRINGLGFRPTQRGSSSKIGNSSGTSPGISNPRSPTLSGSGRSTPSLAVDVDRLPTQVSRKVVISVYLKYHAQILRYLVRKGVPDHLADDVVQRMYLSLQGCPMPRQGQDLKKWLFRKAWDDRLNRRWSEIRRQDREAKGSSLERPSTPEEFIALYRIEKQLRQVWEGLPSMEREAFGLIEFEGLTVKEVARRLDKSIIAINSAFQRARRKLAKANEGQNFF